MSRTCFSPAAPSLLLTLLLTLLAASPLHAQDSVWRYRVQDVVPKGEPGLLILFPEKDVRDVTIELTAGKTRQVLKRGNLGGGAEHRVNFKTPPGKAAWHARITARTAEGPTSMEFDFEVAALDDLVIKLTGDTNLPTGRVVLVANRPLKSADVVVFDKSGQEVVNTQVDLAGTGAGAPTTVSWPATGPDIRRVDLRLTDTFGLWSQLRAVSWYAEVPHDDVIFESGRWDIRESEFPKLQRAIAAVNDELTRFREELGHEAATDAALFVAGHTDTVGSNGDNQSLSEKRARVIAEYFRKNGLKVPVYYHGAGEHGLAVETGDNVDEARNRRAVYVISNAPPGVGAYAAGGWRRL
ncbi:OmpA family protein [Myxococcota bacterium]|nr:OmpA family protein [Myxococcota bacterium]